MPVGYQVVFRAEDDRVLAPTDEARRAFATSMARVGRPSGLFAFGLADTHGHAALACDAARLGRFVHDMRLSLAHTLGLPFVAPSVWPIRDTWHAQSVIGYVHAQDAHHGVGTDPRREGTSLHDLFGLRPAGSWLVDRVRAVAPRVSRADLLAQWGIRSLDEAVDLAHLADAGAAAVGLGRLVGRSAEVVAARHACVHAASELPIAEVAAALDVGTRAIREIRNEPADPRLVRAVRLQMGLRRVAAAPRGFAPDAASP